MELQFRLLDLRPPAMLQSVSW